VVDCVICNKSIHFDHNEGELMKCLKQMNLKLAETNKFLKEIIPLKTLEKSLLLKLKLTLMLALGLD